VLKINQMYKEKIRFLISGGFSTSLSYLLYATMIYFDFRYYLSMTMAYMLGYISNFVIGRYWVFEGGRKLNSISKEIFLTLAVTIIGLVLNLLIIKILSETVFHINYYLSGFIAIFIVTFWNYWGRKKWIYN